MNVFSNNILLFVPLRTGYRGIHLILHIGLAAMTLAGMSILSGRRWHLTRTGQFFYKWWMGRACRIIGIQITQYGQSHDKTALHAANHVSFLDIIVLGAINPVRFLSKKSVRYWPVIGYLTASAGSVFIQRSKRSDVHKTKNVLCKALHEQRPLAIFPEGTTSLGDIPGKFHSGLFQAAIDTAIPVQPVAIRYLESGQLDRTAAYIENDNFVLTLLKIISRASTSVHLVFCPPIQSSNMQRQELARQSREIIAATLEQYIPVKIR